MAATPESPEKEYCSTSEAAQRLSLSLGTIQQMVENGQLEGWKTAVGHRRIRVSSIEEFRYLKFWKTASENVTVLAQEYRQIMQKRL